MLVTLLLWFPLGLSGAVPGRGGEVAAILERAAKAARTDAGALRAELVALGPAFTAELFDALAFGPAGRTALPVEQEALLATLTHRGPLPLRPLLEGRLAGEPPPEVRLAALLLLARVGTSLDLGLLGSAVAGAGPGLEEALQEACAGIARTDPRILEPLRRWLIEAPVEIGAAIARGVGDSERPEALAVLAAALGYRPELDPELLAQVGARAACAPKPIDERILDLLADALQADDAGSVRAAAIALGHAEDHRTVPELIPLLEHPVRGVRAGALWALEHLSGLRFGPEPGRWAEWLATEEVWHASGLPQVVSRLQDPQPGVAIRALGELSGRRWQRHELALEAAKALEHELPSVRRLACLTLARLGSSAALPELQSALEDLDEGVVEAARLALELLAPARGPCSPGARP